MKELLVVTFMSAGASAIDLLTTKPNLSAFVFQLELLVTTRKVISNPNTINIKTQRPQDTDTIHLVDNHMLI
jgi:hypothetical protein